MILSENALIERLKESIIAFDEDEARKVAEEIVAADLDPLKVIQEGISVGAKVVSDKFESEEYYLPELMLAGEDAGDRDHGHGVRGHPRHRQEHPQHAPHGQRVQGHRPRQGDRLHGDSATGPGVQSRHHRTLSPHDYHHALPEGGH